MCAFIESEHILPGLICCACHTYNGLQREFCHGCDTPLHKASIPASLPRCRACGFGYSSDGMLPFATAAGRTLAPGECPVCGTINHVIPAQPSLRPVT